MKRKLKNGVRRVVVALFTPSSMIRRKLRVAIWTVMWVGAAGLFAADEPWLVYSATETRQAPVINGRLDDACWREIEQTRPFVCTGGAAAPNDSRGMACWDARNLYVGFICAESMLADIRKKKADGLLQPFDESVEIFVDADHDHFTYVQFRVDIVGNRDTRIGQELDQTMDKRWSGAAAEGQSQWTAEAAIPWELVTKRQPTEKTVWGLNLNRCRLFRPEGKWTCWSDTKGPFHSPERFGHLIFFSYSTFLPSYFAASFRATRDEISQIQRRLKTATAADTDRLTLLQLESEQLIKALRAAPMVKGSEAAAFYSQGVAQERKWESFQCEMNLRLISSLSTPSGTK